MLYGEQLMISLIYLKTCGVKKWGEEKKATASTGLPHLLGLLDAHIKVKNYH